MEESARKRVTIRKTRSGFASREQKASFGLLIGTGFLAFILGGVYMIRHLNQPFDVDYVGPRYVSSEELQQEELEKQKITDTDNDGVTDFDELYFYKTSPYLFDSDGDGLSDAAEIASGDDPNCPRGEECVNSIFDDGLIGENSFIEAANESAAASARSIFTLSEAVKNMSIEQVKELLIQSGVEQEAIDSLSDEELMVIYQVVISDLESSGEFEQIISAAVSEQNVAEQQAQ